MNPYADSGEVNELSIDRNIPDKTVAMVTLSGIPEIKEVGKNKTPVAEAQYIIAGGQFEGRKVRKSFWLNPTPKEGKDKSALYWTKVALCDQFLKSIGCPEPEFLMGKESPASQAKRAPFIQKWQAQISKAVDAKSLVQLATQPVVGKQLPARIQVSDSNGFKNTEVGKFLSAEEYKKAITPVTISAVA
jgi:hypothetical protein